MNYYTASGIQNPPITDWNDTPEDIRVSYLQQTEKLMQEALTIAELKAKEAEIYNRHFRMYGFTKPLMS